LDIDRLAERYEIYSSAAEKEAKRRMLRAALRLLSEKSFREAEIYEFTGEAGYAVRMFYKVYGSKNDLLADLIAILSKTVRRYLTECTSAAGIPWRGRYLGRSASSGSSGGTPRSTGLSGSQSTLTHG